MPPSAQASRKYITYSTTQKSNNRMKKNLSVFLLFLVIFGGSGCLSKNEEKPQLLIYCGITMARPMNEIAAIIEEQEDVEVIIIQGGSGNLLKSIELNGIGDIYLPGSKSYVDVARTKGLVVDARLVGYNRAALMVQKDNPLNLTADLQNLLSPEYYVILGNPDSGSIGKETQRILERAGLYDAAIQNARELTTDSKDLVTALVEKRADLVINWYAVSTWDGNDNYFDVILLDPEIAPPKELVITSLTTAREPALAKRFIEYAVSPEGRAIFERYGFAEFIE